MRSDSNLKSRFHAEGVDTREYGSMPGVLDTNTRVEGRGRVLRSHAFSGHETNSLFLNARGQSFGDWSALAGVDSIADGRGFAFLDFDRDGWTDIALVNSNGPQLELFRNRLGDLGGRGRSIQVRLVGAHGQAGPGTGQSARDPAGAHVVARVGDTRLRREHRLGDGFAIQNSAILSLGIGPHESAEEVQVIWPSGRTTEVGSVPAGTFVTVKESPPPGETAITTSPRQPPGQLGARGAPLPVDQWPGQLPESKARLNLVTTMATWCAVCRGELPHLQDMRASVPETDLALYGFPIDPDDSSDALAAYADEKKPAYTLMPHASLEDRAAVKAQLVKHLGEATLPATFLIDARGRILRIRKGVPTLSEVRQWLQKMP